MFPGLPLFFFVFATSSPLLCGPHLRLVRLRHARANWEHFGIFGSVNRRLPPAGARRYPFGSFHSGASA
jgi:hypothetical protein